MEHTGADSWQKNFAVDPSTKDSQISQQAAGIGEIDHLIGGDGTKRSGIEVWLDQIAMMHTDTSHANFHAPSKEEKYVELPSEKWRSEYPEYGRLRVSLLGTRDAAANWEDACAKVLTEHGFARGILLQRTWDQGCRAWRRFLVWRPQRKWDSWKSCGQAKHTVMGESSVMLNRRISWRDNARAGHETLPKNCRSIESATSKNSGITSSRGTRDRSATRRMLWDRQMNM